MQFCDNERDKTAKFHSILALAKMIGMMKGNCSFWSWTKLNETLPFCLARYLKLASKIGYRNYFLVFFKLSVLAGRGGRGIWTLHLWFESQVLYRNKLLGSKELRWLTIEYRFVMISCKYRRKHMELKLMEIWISWIVSQQTKLAPNRFLRNLMRLSIWKLITKIDNGTIPISIRTSSTSTKHNLAYNTFFDRKHWTTELGKISKTS